MRRLLGSRAEHGPAQGAPARAVAARQALALLLGGLRRRALGVALAHQARAARAAALAARLPAW